MPSPWPSNAESSNCSRKNIPRKRYDGGPFQGCPSWRQFNTIEQGCILQRLFSTFPNSWPGVGLLLLRLSLAVTLLYYGIAGFPNLSETTGFAQQVMASACGAFLFAGLWTPVTGALVALDEFWIAFSIYSPLAKDMWIHVFLAIQALSVTMLGPGAWSIDARLFGRKRFDIDQKKRRPPSDEVGEIQTIEGSDPDRSGDDRMREKRQNVRQKKPHPEMPYKRGE